MQVELKSIALIAFWSLSDLLRRELTVSRIGRGRSRKTEDLRYLSAEAIIRSENCVA